MADVERKVIGSKFIRTGPDLGKMVLMINDGTETPIIDNFASTFISATEIRDMSIAELKKHEGVLVYAERDEYFISEIFKARNAMLAAK